MPWPPDDQRTDTADRSAHRGLGDKDRFILDAWLDEITGDPLPAWYNVIVGNEPPILSDARSPAEARWIRATYMKRPDIIIRRRNLLSIIEVKPRASYMALGQALLYSALAATLANPLDLIEPVILTDLADPDLITALQTLPQVRLAELGHTTQPPPTFPT